MGILSPVSTHSYCPPSSRVWDMMCPCRARCWAVLGNPVVCQAGGSCEMFRWSQRYLWYLMEGSKAQFLTRKRRTQHSENTTSTWDEEPYFGFTVSMLYNSFVHGTSLEPGWGSFNSLSPSQCSSSPFPILAPLSFEHRDLGWLETLGFPVV